MVFKSFYSVLETAYLNCLVMLFFEDFNKNKSCRVKFVCFLDLGANIGMFTLAVAAMGRKVKAVDAAFKNHAYIR